MHSSSFMAFSTTPHKDWMQCIPIQDSRLPLIMLVCHPNAITVPALIRVRKALKVHQMDPVFSDGAGWANMPSKHQEI